MCVRLHLDERLGIVASYIESKSTPSLFVSSPYYLSLKHTHTHINIHTQTEAKRQIETEKRTSVLTKATAELSKFNEEREVMREKKQSNNRKEEQVCVYVGR